MKQPKPSKMIEVYSILETWETSEPDEFSEVETRKVGKEFLSSRHRLEKRAVIEIAKYNRVGQFAFAYRKYQNGKEGKEDITEYLINKYPYEYEYGK